MADPAPKNICKDVVIPPTTGIADTYNWDTAYGITFEKVNAAIVRAKSSPAKFKGVFIDPFSKGKYDIAADLGPWQLSGGSGDLVHMTLPLNNGTITPQAGGSPTQFSGSATIEVQLQWLPQPNATADVKGRHDLKIKLTTNDPQNSPIVSIETININPQNYGTA